jgi:hypothetical protein
MTAAEQVQYAIQRSRARGCEQVILRAESPAEFVGMHSALLLSHSGSRVTEYGIDFSGTGWNVLLAQPQLALAQRREE